MSLNGTARRFSRLCCVREERYGHSAYGNKIPLPNWCTKNDPAGISYNLDVLLFWQIPPGVHDKGRR